ncbi:hypothetical protein [Mycolicibacterium sp.]|uniref:hypothetical protein n=1 Tax=Mycolicibacterium sp. TaxID=2320850 RepID=UPI003566EE65
MAADAVLADRNEVSAADQLTHEQAVELLASIGVYPVGPGAQIARLFGAGTPQDAVRTLGLIASLIPGEIGTNLQASLQAVAAALEAAQDGLQILPPGVLPDTPPITIPAGGSIGLDLGPLASFLIGSEHGLNIPALALSSGLKLAFPEIAVPQFGPAGTYDAVAGLEGDLSTQLILTLLKTLQGNTDELTSLVQQIDGLPNEIKELLPGELATLLPQVVALAKLIEAIPLNVPAEVSDLQIEAELLGAELLDLDLELFFSTATKLAILPSFGLGGTNLAFVAPYFLNEDKFADTVVLAIPIRNTSRPGGGIIALLNPLSSLVGINLANVDGREGNGNVTFWDITAAYDLLSDAPSTIYNPVAWANSATGAVMPTYLIPQNVETFASVIEDVVSGNISLDTIMALLATGDIASLFHAKQGADGNLYITYDSGHLPLLEPFQFLPRTISYLPGFDISTPFSESFNDVLTQLVAMGYQDVDLKDGDPGEIPSFLREWDEGGTQAKFWTSPVSFEDGLQAPQALFNALIGDGISTGLTGNLLRPDAQELTLFGSSALGDAVYKNPVSVAVAGLLREALLELKNQLNPIFDAIDSNEFVKTVAQTLDDAVGQVDELIEKGGDAVKGLGINLSDPIMDVNRGVNRLVGDTTLPGIAEGAQGLSPLSSDASAPAAVMKSTAPEAKSEQPESNVFQLAAEDADIETDTDLLTNTEVAQDAKKVADALNPRKALQAAAAEADERVEKRMTKTQNSLRKANERAALVGDKLRDGDVTGAAKQVGDNIANRVDRVKRDINNGVGKITGKKSDDSDKSGTSGTSGKSDNDSGSKKDAA